MLRKAADRSWIVCPVVVVVSIVGRHLIRWRCGGIGRLMLLG